MTTKEKQKPEYSSWEDIKAQYPDRFVLIENPVYQTDKQNSFLILSLTQEPELQ